jgi:hypothetical protein
VVRVESAPDTVFMVVLSMDTAPEREEILAVFVAVCPERVARFPERVLTVVVRIERDPERVAIFVFIPAIVPERAFCARKSVK